MNTNSPSQEVGFVKQVRDFLVHLDGMPTIKVNDMVETEDQTVRGWVYSLLPDQIEVLLVDEATVKPGQMFRRSGKRLTVPVDQFLIGRAIDPLGVPLDGQGPISKTGKVNLVEIDFTARGISEREFIKKQFNTGVTLVDTLIPIGHGQRELILGDARSGKTSFLVDIICNQKTTGVICIYASMGKPTTEVRNLLDILKVNQALNHTIVIAASSSDPAPLIFLTPRTAFAAAEFFQKQGKDVLLILDDMGTHAKIYREISLLAGRAPGRESYPGDIFYQHAHLLERAGNFRTEAGGGSITALPVIELNLNDFTTFIPTNIMAMTDGHLLFRSSLYNQGQRPAIDIPLSVSRVGQQTQSRIQNLMGSKIKQILAEASQMETLSRFSFELSFQTQLTLKQKELIEELIKQQPLNLVPKEIQVILLALPFTSFLQNKDRAFIIKFRSTIIQTFLSHPKLTSLTQNVDKLSSIEELVQQLETLSPLLNQLTSEKKGGK